MGEIERTWKVGELARATGLTTRALHHYDDIELLVPGRTDGGHRVYSAADVERLYRVLALRGVGLSLDEIGAVLDDEDVGLIDTMRRHVAAVERDIEQRRRLLRRLRDMLDGLERSSAPTTDELIGAVEAMTVVEATIEDIVTRERWDAAWELTAQHVVLLREKDGDRVLPIWIGEPEAAALVMQRRGAKTPRPMGHDLMAGLLSALDSRVERVVIERLQDNTFFATVTVLSGDDPREVDARPSDALNLALRCGAPILVASDVIDAASLGAWPRDEPVPQGGSDPPPWTPVDQPRGPDASSRHPAYTVGALSPMVLQTAAAQARDLGHGFVGVPHLLLGILADQDVPAARVLRRHGVTLAATRDAVAARLGGAQNAEPPGASMALAPSAALIMQRASTEARRRGVPDVAPMHLLLALAGGHELRDVPGLSAIDWASVREDARAALDD